MKSVSRLYSHDVTSEEAMEFLQVLSSMQIKAQSIPNFICAFHNAQEILGIDITSTPLFQRLENRWLEYCQEPVVITCSQCKEPLKEDLLASTDPEELRCWMKDKKWPFFCHKCQKGFIR